MTLGVENRNLYEDKDREEYGRNNRGKNEEMNRKKKKDLPPRGPKTEFKREDRNMRKGKGW